MSRDQAGGERTHGASITRFAAGLAAVVSLLALVVTGAVSVPVASADDSKSTSQRYVVKGDPYKLVGAKVAAQLKAAQSINDHATGPKRRVLDYRLANKWDKGQTTVRRQFAASWLWTGRTIKNISKKERTVVKAYVKRYFSNNGATRATQMDSAPRCRGRSGFTSLGGGEWNAYFSSCGTTVLIAELQVAGIAAGYVATRLPFMAPVALLTAAALEIGAVGITALRDLSSEGAVYVIRRMIGPPTARQQIITMLPQ